MGMRNIVGEKADLWEVVAKELGLPAPADRETHQELDAVACQAWMRMGHVIRNWFRVQVAQGGMISGAQQDYFKEVDPDFKVRSMLATHQLELAMFMRCVGILEADFAEHELRLETEQYAIWIASVPHFYTWWTAPEGWTKGTANLDEDEHEAYEQQRRLIEKAYRFTWG